MDIMFRVFGLVVFAQSKCSAKAADLATKLSIAREELEKLRDRLDSAEVAKEDAEHALEKAKKQVCSAAVRNPQVEEPRQSLEQESKPSDDGISMENKLEEQRNHGELHESAVIMELKAMILEKDKKVEILLKENMIFKRKSEEEAMKLSAAARAKEEELEAKIDSIEAELKESKARGGQLAALLAATEGEKETVEVEMRRMRVQMEQWRKAAEAATALLATGEGGFMVEMGGRRCRLVDKHLDGWGSLAEMGEEEGGRGWRKMAGMQVLGEMWKKRMQH